MKSFLLVVALLAVGCSGKDSPTSPGGNVPSMAGAWTGTLTLTLINVGTGVRSSNTCTQSWLVQTQTGGSFTGTYQLSGGTATPCADAGTLAGTVTATTLSVRFTSGTSSICTRIAGDGVYSGVVSAHTATAQTTDRLSCTSGFVTLVSDRTLTVSVH